MNTSRTHLSVPIIKLLDSKNELGDQVVRYDPESGFTKREEAALRIFSTIMVEIPPHGSSTKTVKMYAAHSIWAADIFFDELENK